MSDEHDGHQPVRPRRQGMNAYRAEELPAQHVGESRYAALPPGPKPDPNPESRARVVAEHLPTARVAPAVDELMNDIMVLCSQEITRLKAMPVRTPNDIKNLEGVARTVKLTHELQHQVQKEREEEFGKQDEEALRKRAEELRTELRSGGESD